MQAYNDLAVYFGDMHTHCGISYGHGPLEDALKNAREQLDFCSITGHAHWPDMPAPNERIQYIIDFHRKGFAKLKSHWQEILATLKKADKEGEFVVFPSFEVHFNSCGDRTIMYKDIAGELLYTDSHEQLCDELRKLKKNGLDSICFPHHIGYRKGTRGIDWKSLETDLAPFVEIVSMHGCSETNENTRPFLHSMGPSDWESTVQYGLEQGYIFGFSGNTDHHSAHPGSYGHGITGVWAEELTRESIWKAINDRRVYALTGDHIKLKFSVNNSPMGSIIEPGKKSLIKFDVEGGGAIDYIDLVKNNHVIKRFSECDFNATKLNGKIKSKLHLELGWGERKKSDKWDVELGVSDGKIVAVEPRFRGREVVSPVEQNNVEESLYYTSHWENENEKTVHFKTVSEGNPNNSTNATQGISVEVEMPTDGQIKAQINGKHELIPVKKLIAGARTGHLGLIDSPAYRFNRMPLPSELNWAAEFVDESGSKAGDFYYLRVRQKNDQWAWSSPVFVR